MFDIRDLSNGAIIFFLIVAFASAYSTVVVASDILASKPSAPAATRVIDDLVIDPSMRFCLFPQNVEVDIGDTFVVSVTVGNATDMYGWQTYLEFDPTMLRCLGVSVSSDYMFSSHVTVSGALVNYDRTEFGSPLQAVRNDEGWLLAGDCLLGANQQTLNGSGVLCQIEFEAIRTGSSALSLFHDYAHKFQTLIVTSDLNCMTPSSMASIGVTARAKEPQK